LVCSKGVHRLEASKIDNKSKPPHSRYRYLRRPYLKQNQHNALRLQSQADPRFHITLAESSQPNTDFAYNI
jgi:hypothetical protein